MFNTIMHTNVFIKSSLYVLYTHACLKFRCWGIRQVHDSEANENHSWDRLQ